MSKASESLAHASLAEIIEQAARLDHKDDEIREAATEAVHEAAYGVEVRDDWRGLGESPHSSPAEFRLTLAGGGPALRMVGELSQGEPYNVRLEHQDWFEPWAALSVSRDEERALQRWASVFYFGD